MKRAGRFKRKSRLRPRSPKRAAQIEEFGPIREAFKQEFAKCMYPGCKSDSHDTHEITNASRRGKSLGERAVLLRLCRRHHEELTGLPLKDKWTTQLAIKLIADPVGYSLERFRELMNQGGRIVEQEEIDEVVRKYRATM